MTERKLVYVVSEIDKSLHFEWITPYLKTNFKLSFILIGNVDSTLERFLKRENVRVFPIAYRTKMDLFVVWLRVFKILITLRPDIVHTHLWIANLVGLTAGFFAGVRRRIYTRHHATIHYTEHPAGLKWDKLSNRIATDVIAISGNIKNLLIERDRAKSSKVKLIYHGFDFGYFADVPEERIDRLYDLYNISRLHHPILGVISRLTEWKGVQFIIPAFIKLRSVFPDAHLILANAHGPFERTIDRMLASLPQSSYTKITFEEDVAALYRLFDIFIHVPVDAEAEAFGQTYVEALIAGVPGIFTLSGIAREFIVHEKNALVVGFKDSEQISLAINRIIADTQLRNDIAEGGKKSVGTFTIDRYLKQLETLYRS